MPKEAVFKKAVMKKLKTLPKTWATTIQQASINGSPDIIGCCNGYMFGWELKKCDASKATELQKYVLKKISEAGGIGEIVRPSNFEEQFARLKKLSEEL